MYGFVGGVDWIGGGGVEFGCFDEELVGVGGEVWDVEVIVCVGGVWYWGGCVFDFCYWEGEDVG